MVTYKESLLGECSFFAEAEVMCHESDVERIMSLATSPKDMKFESYHGEAYDITEASAKVLKETPHGAEQFASHPPKPLQIDLEIASKSPLVIKSCFEVMARDCHLVEEAFKLISVKNGLDIPEGAEDQGGIVWMRKAGLVTDLEFEVTTKHKLPIAAVIESMAGLEMSSLEGGPANAEGYFAKVTVKRAAPVSFLS